MTVRRYLTAMLALCALLLGSACGDRSGPGLPPEMDEPLFVEGMQLKKQGRSSEALASFLKLIEKRGLRQSAESHLEAGLIYFDHAKDPIRAIYHFRQYLELQPNSAQAGYVRGMVHAAERELAKALMLGPGADERSTRGSLVEELDKLRRENSELRAEIQVLRSSGATAAARTPRVISLPENLRAQNAAPPPPTAPVINPSAGGGAQMVPAPTRAANVASSPTPPTVQLRATPSRGGRTHTVQPKQSLYSIARQYGVSLEDLARANGIADPSKVAAGTVLRIP